MSFSIKGRINLKEGLIKALTNSSITENLGPWGNFPMESKLITSLPSDALFGYNVSISGDGNTALIGAITDDLNFGSAYIYVKDGNSWVQQTKFSPPDRIANGRFGWYVDLSFDGNTAVVAARNDDDNGNFSGSVYIFTRFETSWTQQQKITPTDGAMNKLFGSSVAISDDGNTLVVGSQSDNAGGTNSGAAYIFVRSGSSWSQQRKLTASDPAAGDNFGISVSISGDGNLVVVGSRNDDDTFADSGSAYVFIRSGIVWSQQQKLTASDPVASKYFGISVSISGDKNTILIGAFGDPYGGANTGSAYIFNWNGSSWIEQIKLIASDGAASDTFGSSVHLAFDGNTAIIGSQSDDTESGINTGSAYIFIRNGIEWVEKRKITAFDASENDYYGYSVHLSSDGNTAIVGAYNANDGANHTGSAYIYETS